MYVRGIKTKIKKSLFEKKRNNANSELEAVAGQQPGEQRLGSNTTSRCLHYPLVFIKMDGPEVSVELTKQVVTQLNSLLDKKFNVISYDNLRDEQRIELLLQVLKDIDPSVCLYSCSRVLILTRAASLVSPDEAQRHVV